MVLPSVTILKGQKGDALELHYDKETDCISVYSHKCNMWLYKNIKVDGKDRIDIELIKPLRMPYTVGKMCIILSSVYQTIKRERVTIYVLGAKKLSFMYDPIKIE